MTKINNIDKKLREDKIYRKKKEREPRGELSNNARLENIEENIEELLEEEPGQQIRIEKKELEKKILKDIEKEVKPMVDRENERYLNNKEHKKNRGHLER